MKIFKFIFILLLSISNYSHSEEKIGKIFIDRKEVFEPNQSDWFFAAPLANFFHILTKEYIIKDELLFEEGDELDEELLEETERNLRNMDIFTNVRIEYDENVEDIFDIYITTQDKWSTRPALLYGKGGETYRIGGRFEELNFLGTASRINIEALYRSENDIGMQGNLEFSQNRLFRSDYKIDFKLTANKYRTDQFLSVSQPFRALDSKFSYGVELTNYYGSDFLFEGNNKYTLMPFKERRGSAWFSRGWKRKDRVFFSALVEFDDVERSKPEYKRAFDNSGKILFGFSSISQDLSKEIMLNNYLDEDLSIGGWGTAILGKVFPIGHRGEGLYYLAAQGEKSVMYGNTLYLFGQLTGASGFANSNGYYTYQEFMGLSFLRITQNILLAARVRQQSVWNWSLMRQLILDNETGLRGYPANSFIGDNRMFANVELRAFPNIPFWIFNFSAVLFYDTGSAWEIHTDLSKTQWHNSVGFGIRIHDNKSRGATSAYRIDFAFNLDKGKLGEIILSTDQFFSVFQNHSFKKPQIFGLEFDYE